MLITNYVLFPLLFIIMLRTVKLNDQLGNCTIEIDNILTNHFLTLDGHRQLFKEVVPEMSFFFSHFSS